MTLHFAYNGLIIKMIEDDEFVLLHIDDVTTC